MDIFGKTSNAKPKSQFQNELAAKMKQRKAQGFGADLTETEEEDDGPLESDDDLLATFNNMTSTKKSQPQSQSPWGAEAEGRKSPKVEPPKPQIRGSLGAKESKPKAKIGIKPKNELDRLLADDDENEDNLMQTQKKPWQPPQFKDFSSTENRRPASGPQPIERANKKSPFMKSNQQSALQEEDEEESEDEELAGAYNSRQLQQRELSSPAGRHTPLSRKSPLTSTAAQSPGSKSPLLQKGRQTPERTTPKTREDELFGNKSGSKPRNNLDDIFGRHKSPSDQDMFGGKKTPKSEFDGMSSGQFGEKDMKKTKQGELLGRKTPPEQDFLGGRKTPKSKEINGLSNGKSEARDKRKTPQDELFGRKSPSGQDLFGGRKTPNSKEINGLVNDKFEAREKRKTPQDELFGRKSPSGQDLLGGRKTPKEPGVSDVRKTPQDELFGRKSPKQSSTLDDIFGTKKRAESPLFKAKQSPGARDGFQRNEVGDQSKPQPATRKGSYMSSLLADSDEEKEERQQQVKPNTRTSYLNSLLGDESTAESSKPKTYLDSLLSDDKETGHKPRARQRMPAKDNGAAEERESSVGRDVEKDPLMIEKIKVEREEKKKSQKGKGQTGSQQAEFDIEEVADAQNSLAMTYIQSEKPASANRSTTVSKPKPRRPNASLPVSPNSSTVSFESASDIRNYIYKEWKEKKQVVSKQTLSSKKQQEKEEQKRKEKEELDKKLENEATFRTWKEQKDERLRERIKAKKREEKKKAEEEQKEHQSKSDAEKIFKKWKESKDEQIVERKRKERKGEVSKLTEKQEEEARKKKDAEGAFTGWKKQKDQNIRHTVRQSKVIEKQEVTQKMTDTRRREIEAEQLYEKWLQRKEEQKRREKLQARSRKSLQESPRPAWSPANKTIPSGR